MTGKQKYPNIRVPSYVTPSYRKYNYGNMDTQIYIFNSGGCHGHYLTYLIDRLSRKTPTIKETFKYKFLPITTKNKKTNIENKHEYFRFSYFTKNARAGGLHGYSVYGS